LKGADAGQGNVEREIARLASERTALFGRSGASARLSKGEQSRLRTIERELDERFQVLRGMRAVQSQRRFKSEDPVAHRATRPQHRS
jgi:hypothetical protein